MGPQVHRELFDQQIAPFSITATNGRRGIIPALKKCTAYEVFKKDFLKSLKEEELNSFNSCIT